MKIGLPKLRLSRKLLVITLSVTVLLGGTGVTALYFGGKVLMLEGGVNAVGGECTDIQTVVVKTPSDHLWLRKFIRMENASGIDRVRTALRISGLLAKKHAVDLIHVSVLDAHGPTVRSQMRSRSIGAEVLIALKPENLPEMKSPAMASYYEGPASAEGRYYGDKVIVDINEISAMMTAMRTVQEKPDCVSLDATTNAEAKPKDEGKTEEQDAKSVNHGTGASDEGGQHPAAENTDQAADGDRSAREHSFLDTMLSMVGFGSSEKATERHGIAEDAAASIKPGLGTKVRDASVSNKTSAATAEAEAHTPAQEAADDEHTKGYMPVGD